MKIKTSEATGLQLDWGLSLALGHEKTAYIAECGSVHGRDWTSVEHVNADLCLGLIKEHRFPIFAYIQVGGDGCLWQVNYCDADVNAESWESLEQAVARCVIAMKLGDEFECPSELGGVV